MSLYGKMESAYFQVTELGASHFGSQRLEPATREVFKSIAERGGLAEYDEISQDTFLTGTLLNKALRDLVDLGWIVATQLPTTTAPVVA